MPRGSSVREPGVVRTEAQAVERSGRCQGLPHGSWFLAAKAHLAQILKTKRSDSCSHVPGGGCHCHEASPCDRTTPARRERRRSGCLHPKPRQPGPTPSWGASLGSNRWGGPLALHSLQHHPATALLWLPSCVGFDVGVCGGRCVATHRAGIQPQRHHPTISPKSLLVRTQPTTRHRCLRLRRSVRRLRPAARVQLPVGWQPATVLSSPAALTQSFSLLDAPRTGSRSGDGATRSPSAPQCAQSATQRSAAVDR